MRMSNSQSTRMIRGARPYFDDSEIEEILPGVESILRSGWLILGEHTAAFEEEFRRYVGSRYAVAVSSCSAALQIVLRYYKVDGRDVILPTNNFPGDVSAVLYEGGTPVLADMDPATFCIDTDDAMRRLTERTRAVIVTHLAGLVYPDIDRLRAECAKRGVFLIEDASHAHGAAIGKRKAGSLADAGVFSFYPTKIMTSSVGGMITTDDEKLAEYARLVRHHGQGKRREDFVSMGSDWCMSEIHAVTGLAQLKRLDERVDYRNQLVDWYRQELAGADWLEIPRYPAQFRHAYYKLPTIVAEDVNRDLLRQTLETEFGIQNGTVYDPPCHLQGAFRELLRIPEGSLPNAERILARQLCPPVHTSVTREDVAFVAETMLSVIERCRVPSRRR